MCDSKGLPHILHIRDSSGIYGAERVLLTLAKNVDRNKFRLSVLCMQRGDGKSGALEEKVRDLGIQVYGVSVKTHFDIVAIGRIRKIIKKENVTCLHSHDFKSDFYSLGASLGLKIFRVITAHGTTKETWKKKAYIFLTENITYRMCHKVIAVSKELNEYFLGKGFSPEKVRLIQNGLDLSLLSSGSSESNKEDLPFNLPNGSRVFVVVGRLFPDKGHRYFLQAFSKVRQSHPSIVALIVGDGPLFEDLRENIDSLGLNDSVFLTGVRRNIRAIYRMADFMIIPSLREGLPYVLLEAMANKVLVVATSVGGIPSLIKDGETGFLVRPGKAREIAEKMELVLSQPVENTKIVEQALRHVSEHFTASKMVDKTEKLYRELIEI